ncbi:metallophosphoesterase [uncultured Methylophaga sp.]|uniref:metallophosphoesterase n=1 Tax=uncultured Methylophaga sp. TaxID=285271 RepID=UPI002622201C|nr:metallophosphoesterase [uncultured Methylophaga sp.]
MKLLLQSDLHMEMGEFIAIDQTEADVVVLAGDINIGTRGLEWAIMKAKALSKPFIYVAGNHEYYRKEYFGLQADLRAMAAEHENVHFLEEDEVVIDGVRFLGATLWTDYKATTEFSQAANMGIAGVSLNDHRLIRYGDERFTPEHALALNQKSVAWLTEKLDTPFDGKTVVVTHHGPSLKSAHPEYGLNQLSTAFISNLDDLVEKADVWCFGHTHSGIDTQVGKCRLVSNQRGYPMERLPVPFNRQFTVTV